MWRSVAASSSPSVSVAALTVTVCAVFQFVVLNVRAEETLTSVLPALRVGVTTTLPVGVVASTTV